MIPAYMPFTYISEAETRLLATLVGPLVIYQPLKTDIPESLSDLASQKLIEIRTPLTNGDDRLHAALVEFTEWARMNPGKSTAGAGFFSARQGEVPFFDDTAINRIRSEIRKYGSPDHPSAESEETFRARLFLAVAQENDLANDHLDLDLNRFKVLEKDFLETLKDADEAGFNRQANTGTIWREDPGATLTGQRIRAWAALAAADPKMPDLLITTSRAVMDTLSETGGEAGSLEKLTDIRLPVPPAGTVPMLGRVLADLAAQETPPSADLARFAALAAGTATTPVVTVSLLIAANRTPATVVRQMASATAVPHDEDKELKTFPHTLFVLVEK